MLLKDRLQIGYLKVFCSLCIFFEKIFCKPLIAIGNAELESKFAKGIELIKRDIVFAASLYL